MMIRSVALSKALHVAGTAHSEHLKRLTIKISKSQINRLYQGLEAQNVQPWRTGHIGSYAYLVMKLVSQQKLNGFCPY